MDAGFTDRLQNVLGDLTEYDLINFAQEVKLIFLGEDDFSSSFELFLDLKIGEV